MFRMPKAHAIQVTKRLFALCPVGQRLFHRIRLLGRPILFQLVRHAEIEIRKFDRFQAFAFDFRSTLLGEFHLVGINAPICILHLVLLHQLPEIIRLHILLH